MTAIEGIDMAKKTKGRGRPSAAYRRMEEQGPTLETVLKARTHALPKLPAWAEEAARGIELGYNLIVREVMPKAGALEPRTGGGGRREMTDGEALAIKRYHDWVRRLEQQHVPLDPVISIIVDGMDPREVDLLHHRVARPGEESWAAGLLLQALALFNTKVRNMA